MYNVSQEYISSLHSKSHQFRLTGRIGDVNITDANVLKGSMSILRQCSEGDDIKIGSVYISELSVTFVNVPIARSTWKNLEIQISEGLKVGNSYEDVPLGIYRVAEAKHGKKGVEITAYDNMAKFDKVFPVSTITGHVYEFLMYSCGECGVQLGMTRQEVEALPNGAELLSLYSDNDIETHRDFISWVAQTTATFAIIDRTGKLVLKKYNQNLVDSFGIDYRFSDGVYSDFISRYTGVSVVDIKNETTKYYHVEPDDGLTYNLGSNPLLQYGTESTKKLLTEAVLNGIQAINYTPFEVEIASGAMYDLGDVVTFPLGRGGGATGCIMYCDWTFQKKSKLKGFGSNPDLASAKSKLDKEISGLIAKVDKDSIQFYNTTNIEDITINNEELKQLLSMRFTTVNSKYVTWQAEILVDVETDSFVNGKIVYYLDGAEVAYHPIEKMTSGKHIIDLYRLLKVEPNTLYRWQVAMVSEGGTIRIKEKEANGTIWGQGLVSTEEWDGYIDCEDTLVRIELDSIDVRSVSDTMSVSDYIPTENDVEDTFGIIVLDDIAIAPMDDYVILNKTSLYIEGMKWQDVYESTWGAIYDEHTW